MTTCIRPEAKDTFLSIFIRIRDLKVGLLVAPRQHRHFGPFAPRRNWQTNDVVLCGQWHRWCTPVNVSRGASYLHALSGRLLCRHGRHCMILEKQTNKNNSQAQHDNNCGEVLWNTRGSVQSKFLVNSSNMAGSGNANATRVAPHNVAALTTACAMRHRQSWCAVQVMQLAASSPFSECERAGPKRAVR